MKRVLLNSGGIESLCLAIKFKDDELHSLYVDFGFPSSPESKQSAQNIADKYCTSHTVITCDGLLRTREINGEIAPMIYQLPFLAIVGSSFASKIGVESVLSGNRFEKYSKDFERYFSLALATNTQEGGKVYQRPLGGLSKEQVIAIIGDDPLLAQTVSCNQSPKCGVCGKCRERIELGIDKESINA